MMQSFILAGTLALAAQGQPSTQAPPFAPGVRYDEKIPTLEQVVGHEPGAEITAPDEIVAYLQALQEAAPERTRLIEYARSWEGRPLYVLAVGSPERMQQFETVKERVQQLANPRRATPGAEAQLIRTLPVLVWLMHGVHGDEISSGDAALLEAYHLLAAQDDPDVDLIRREAIVFIDPMQNPDGRARFLATTMAGRAREPDPEPLAAEHDQPWPGGRTNHYLFDMNRDWFGQSQPETRGRTRFFLTWFPQVVVDLHEMGGNSTYYFAPPANPLNPHISKEQVTWFETFGKANAARFDERGFSYFIREQYDSFYPGYGESWPIFHGAVGMTYEQASARGLVLRRTDEALLTYRDGVLHHFTAAITTAATAARNRAALLRDFASYRRTAVAEGEGGPVRAYVLAPGGDPSRARRLARLLVEQGFDVGETLAPVTLGTRELPAGAFVVPAAQPAARLLRNLLELEVAQPEDFVEEQDRRRKKRLPDQIYDVTAWSLPALFDVELIESRRPISVETRAVEGRADDGPQAHAAPSTEGAVPGQPSNGTSGARALPAARVGYLLPWGSSTAGAVIEALREGLRVRFTGRPFTLGDRRYPIGAAIVRRAENPDDLPTRLAAIVARHDAEAVPADSAYVEDGASLGSNEVVALKRPRVLLAWDRPTQSLSAGAARYVLEQRFGQAATAVRVSSLDRVELSRYDVLILPSGDYRTAITDETLKKVKYWVSAGGTLVTLGDASRWATRKAVGLLATTPELRDGRPATEPVEDENAGAAKQDEQRKAPSQPINLDEAIEPEREQPFEIPGTLTRVLLDQEHWLSAGTDGEIQAMVSGRRVFTPLKLDKGRNVGLYAKRDQLVVSGLMWPESQTLLANKAYLMHQPLGEGHVVGFAEEPNFRAFAEATELLFINAILLGPAY
ncbi:MAG: peptidase M14 [Luteitalea sp.]|nr:peptidase M14 [Luteitalea sp.]